MLKIIIENYSNIDFSCFCSTIHIRCSQKIRQKQRLKGENHLLSIQRATKNVEIIDNTDESGVFSAGNI